MTRIRVWRAIFREFRQTWHWRATLVWFVGYVTTVGFASKADIWLLTSMSGALWHVAWMFHLRNIRLMAESDEWLSYDAWYQAHGQNLIADKTKDTARDLLLEARRQTQRCHGRVDAYHGTRTGRCRLTRGHHGKCE